MIGGPDPKPLDGRRRERDPFAVRIAAAARPECVACGGQGANGHHVLERDDGGDDDARNIVTLCGSGTMGCHGALHGNPYYHRTEPPGRDPETGRRLPEVYERRDRAWVAHRIGTHLLVERLDTLIYLVDRLGPTEAARYLERRYDVPVERLAARLRSAS
jgi:hypothetical protein